MENPGIGKIEESFSKLEDPRIELPQKKWTRS